MIIRNSSHPDGVEVGPRVRTTLDEGSAFDGPVSNFEPANLPCFRIEADGTRTPIEIKPVEARRPFKNYTFSNNPERR